MSPGDQRARSKRTKGNRPGGRALPGGRPSEEARRRRLRLLTVATLAAVAVAALIAIAVRPSPGGTRHEGDQVETLFELDRQPVLGSPDAPVAVVEFADFKCPFCREFSLTVFPRLQQEYVDTGKIRFYFINYPFIGRDSYTAAMAAEAVYALDPRGVWPFMTALMERQGPEAEEWATPEFVVETAREALPGIDAERLAAALRDERYLDEVERDRQIARRAGVSGTPSLFVDGKFVEDWSFEGLKAAIEEALAARGSRSEGSSP